MKVVYYYWGELIADTAQKVLKQFFTELKIVSPNRISYDYDDSFINEIEKNIIDENGNTKYDAVFSFNYFPDLSRIALKCGIKYISWVYDSPHITLESKTISNICNKIFVFDYKLYSKYKLLNIDTVYYMPLPARIIDHYEKNGKIAYEHDITFLGNLYDGEQDQFGKIKFLPGYIEGYIEALIAAQKNVYGLDLFDELISDDVLSEVQNYVHFGMGDYYCKCDADIFKDILRRRVTMNERTEVLIRLGNLFADACDGINESENKSVNVDLYCGTEHPNLPVRNLGFADYSEEMPHIFYSSKINLNITLRSIQTGIPLRIMDILGAGGFCITNYQIELEQYFENGVDLVWYESMDDLESKCKYYLEHDDERELIAKRGQEKVKKLFSYNQLLKKIINICNE